MKVVVILLSYSEAEPAGIERSVAGLATGLTRLGHEAVIVASGLPDTKTTERGRLVLTSALPVRTPLIESDILCAWQAGEARDELYRICLDLRPNVVLCADVTWGLGFDPPLGPWRLALAVHVGRDDELMRLALSGPFDTVMVPSAFVREDMSARGFDTRNWLVVPNALLCDTAPPSALKREMLRREASIRIVARAEPQKGVAEAIATLPEDMDARGLEVVLARASFEYYTGMQDEVIRECYAAARAKGNVTLLPTLPWHEVGPFIAGASIVVVPSVEPETFGLVALEAMSVGTPVCGFDLGHLPQLVQNAGSFTPLGDGDEALWKDLRGLLQDRQRYLAASRAGVRRAKAFEPSAVATTFLAAMASDDQGSRPY